MRTKLEQWRALAPGERRLLVQLAAQLPLTGAMLRLLGFRRTHRLLSLSGGATTEQGGEVSAASWIAAKRVARLVSIASRHGPYRPTCLRQSLVLWQTLRRRGLPAQLRIGVGRPDGRMVAHAWVELGERVVNERPSIGADYAAYAHLDPPPRDPRNGQRLSAQRR